MATIRESLKKLAEVAKPVPGDEQDFVAKHGMKIMDFQGKDSISQESPYDHILKNVASIKAPGQPGKDDHGHDAPGESEAAYHIPESRDAKLAKLSEMMGKDEDEEDEDEEEEAEEEEDEDEKDEENKKKVDEAKKVDRWVLSKDVTGVKMHYHNPKTGEKFHEVHFSVPAAEKFRKQHEKAGFKLVKKEAQFSEEKLPLLPKQKQIARDLLKREMEARKKQRNDNRQAGTPKIMEERREENDKVRMARVATPRPHTPETIQAMRHRLETVKKQIIDKT